MIKFENIKLGALLSGKKSNKLYKVMDINKVAGSVLIRSINEPQLRSIWIQKKRATELMKDIS